MAKQNPETAARALLKAVAADEGDLELMRQVKEIDEVRIYTLIDMAFSMLVSQMYLADRADLDEDEDDEDAA